MVTSAERRRLLSLGQPVPTSDDARLSRFLSTTASNLKSVLPTGWDVTLIASQHGGDGACRVKQSSTLPPQVQRAVLEALTRTDAGEADKRSSRDVLSELLVTALLILDDVDDLAEQERDRLRAALVDASRVVHPLPELD